MVSRFITGYCGYSIPNLIGLIKRRYIGKPVTLYGRQVNCVRIMTSLKPCGLPRRVLMWKTVSGGLTHPPGGAG
ncbi:hypothetical protein [Photorhabdus africana]|uniref:hypothetical protein n=1 Tax=Photorhabdus africana TaxID=3097554 RepID=UPI002B411B44|nr:hypothetical protein [Photorhabdus sp. CRI-LC]